MTQRIFSSFCLLLCVNVAMSDEIVETPRPVPGTRPEMKQLLEDMKQRPHRIPVPELTDADRERLGERADSYESRLRYHYLPGRLAASNRSSRSRSSSDRSASSSQSRSSRPNADENMTLTYPFKTMLFWIVSRTNNCQYCLGHQEQKLIAAGLSENEVASLDSDWSAFTPAEQAAFAYARKLTYEPHLLGDADMAGLREHFTDLQILEMTMSVAGNNATNRWKEGTGIPQSSSGIRFFAQADGSTPSDPSLPIESYLTPTSAKFQNVISIVAPLEFTTSGDVTGRGVSTRPALESREEVEAALAATRSRLARLPVLSEDAARKALGENAPAGPIPMWLRLLANFPNDASRRIDSITAIETQPEVDGDLSLLLKAQVSWIIARQDRAWYATSIARQRLKELGQTPDQIFALDGSWEEFSPADQALFKFAKKQAATPIALTDADVAEALALTGPRQVVQLIDFVTGRAYLDRVTEAAGLSAAGE